MAVVISTVIANKLAGYNNNKPLFLSKNMLAGQTTDVTGGTGPETISACWRMDTSLSTTPLDTTAAGTVTNNSDSFQHPLLACDRQLTGTSAPYVSSARTHALIFACEYSTTTPIDSIAIANHNFAQIPGPPGFTVASIGWSDTGSETIIETLVGHGVTSGREITFTTVTSGQNITTPITVASVTPTTITVPHTVAPNPGVIEVGQVVVSAAPSDLRVKVAISDTNSFASYTVIQEWEAPFTNERLVSLDLGNALGATGAYASYTQVRYLQVFMYGTAAINGPQIGEVFAGPRRQLSRTPLFDSYDADSTTNIIGSFVSKAGNETRYAFATGREIQVPIFNPSGDADLGTTDLYSLNDYATLKTFWADTDYGTHSFFFLPNVSGKPNECFFMYADDLVFPSKIISGLTDHEVDFAFTEVGPFYSSEV